MTDTTTPDAPLLLTLDDAARMLAVSRRTIERMLADGALTPVHIGRAVRVRYADVEGIVAGHWPPTAPQQRPVEKVIPLPAGRRRYERR